MPLEFDGRISWGTLVTVLGLVAQWLYVLFGVMTTVQLNTDAIEDNHRRHTADIARIERDAKEQNRLIIEEIRAIEAEMREARKDNAEGIKRLEDKLDRLFESLMDRLIENGESQ